MAALNEDEKKYRVAIVTDEAVVANTILFLLPLFPIVLGDHKSWQVIKSLLSTDY